jgi:hypothetical protein
MVQNFSDKELFTLFTIKATGDVAVNLSMDIALESAWGVLFSANPLTKGYQIGQKIGSLASNILFNTDEISEAYFSMQQIYDVEKLFEFVFDISWNYLDSRNINDANLID